MFPPRLFVVYVLKVEDGNLHFAYPTEVFTSKAPDGSEVQTRRRAKHAAEYTTPLREIWAPQNPAALRRGTATIEIDAWSLTSDENLDLLNAWRAQQGYAPLPDD